MAETDPEFTMKLVGAMPRRVGFSSEVVAAGAPEEIAKDPSSYTGTFLADVLGISRQRRREPVGARA